MNNIKLGILTFAILQVSIYVFINRGRPRMCKPSLAQSYRLIFVETTNINNATANLGPAEE